MVNRNLKASRSAIGITLRNSQLFRAHSSFPLLFRPVERVLFSQTLTHTIREVQLQSDENLVFDVTVAIAIAFQIRTPAFRSAQRRSDRRVFYGWNERDLFGRRLGRGSDRT